ncbi:ubiquitin-conjugating enzyme E2 T-like [Limulus polyphemus]|uniref:Ubiquitin-conjugating enzyme E2 T-like n=1 Tax=Limulus polyphemus TaxID=6850 RepID=A0ABM1BT70_LIMPO|nr:ubiquitin-conjugating enzyme E2 T-like [Limulus polyphemus]
MQRSARMKKELSLLMTQPPFGVSCWAEDENITHLQAIILGTEGSPYENGLFKLAIQIPDRYPFEPPKVQFMTPIYHPNIDNEGRICLDALQMPPKGKWKPSLTIYSLLMSIQVLMNEPNTDDPLMGDIVCKVYTLFA